MTARTLIFTVPLFARYAERMIIENELDAYISGFHLDALASGVSLNVDLDTTAAPWVETKCGEALARAAPPPPSGTPASAADRRLKRTPGRAV